jgi:predicted enzyme related to lactoylglutathione lyase
VGQAHSITNISSPASFALTALYADQSARQYVGTGGEVVTSFGKTATVGIVAVAIDGEGMLVAAGNVALTGTTGSIVVARYLTK